MVGFALNAKQSARAAAFGIASAAALFVSSGAYANDFSAEQCKIIATTGIEVAKRVGPAKLSIDFKKSFRNYLGQHLMCDGPKDILTPSGIDIDTFNTIQDILTSKAAGGAIDLYKAGVRSVDPKTLAMREQRRTELTAPRPGG